jgi:two-component sensor histidine kinase
MIKRILSGLSFILFCFSGPEIKAQVVAPRHPSDYKISTQRLLLQLSSTYYTVVNENQVDLDSSLLYVSHSLGLSRLPLVAEGINDPELIAKSKWIDRRKPGEGIRMLFELAGKKKLGMLLLLEAYYAFQPDSYHRCKDSVLYFSRLAVKEAQRLHDRPLGRQALLLTAKMYVQAYDFQTGDPIFDRLIQECLVAGDKATAARVLYYRGLYTGFTPANISKRIQFLEDARQLYREQKDSEGEINVLTDICYLETASYRLDNAYVAAVEALRIAEMIQFPYTHYNTEDVAMVTVAQGKFGTPLKYALQSIRTAESTRDSIGWGYFYSRLGLLYFTENETGTEAPKWFEKAVYSLMRSGTSTGLYLSLNNLTAALLNLKQLAKAKQIIFDVSRKARPLTLNDKLFYNFTFAQIYIASRQYDIAERYMKSADSVEKQLEKMGMGFRRAAVTAYFGRLYFFQGDYKKARIFMEQSLVDPSRTGGALNTELSTLHNLIRIDSSEKDKDAEIRHLRMYRLLADSNYVISKTRQGEELQVKYATVEKENQIALLNQQSKLERANLTKATLIRNVTIGAVFFALIISGLLYRQSRQRKANNELITDKNLLLGSLLREKEWLLKEVHHRVKNNLQTIICLLESQAAYLESDALKAIEKSQNRIYTMSLIHQKLYQSEDIETIDMAGYIPELIQYLKDSFDVPSEQVFFRVAIDPVSLDPSLAIPVALIINEALTNSIKYAFADGRKGEIKVELFEEEDIIRLELGDDGVGLEKNLENTDPVSLGLQLIRGLAKEIRSEIQISSLHGQGVRITMIFEKKAFNYSELSASSIIMMS